MIEPDSVDLERIAFLNPLPNTMPLTVITRFIRRKAVLFCIFFCSLCYAIISFLSDLVERHLTRGVVDLSVKMQWLLLQLLVMSKRHQRLCSRVPQKSQVVRPKIASALQSDEPNTQVQAPFSSGDDIDSIKFKNFDSLIWHSDDELGNSSTKLTTCRNSVQGMTLVVDDRGYVCSRFHVLPTGCCDQSKNPIRYSCDTCKDNGCCSIYENCVSCCMQPNKKELLQNMLRRAPDTFHVVFASITDHYELCLAKCRTSSLSVQHENSYRDPSAKHCYNDA